MNDCPTPLASSTTTGPLLNRVRDAMVQLPQQDARQFIPRGDILRLITPDSVENFLSDHENECPRFRKERSEIVNYVCGLEIRTSKPARHLFAILLIIGEPHLILDSLKSDVDDSNLPLAQSGLHTTSLSLTREDGSLVTVFEKWTPAQRQAFYKVQWCICVPYFNYVPDDCMFIDSHPILRLHDSAILPWVEQDLIHDNTCEISRVKIHPAHHNFDAEVSP